MFNADKKTIESFGDEWVRFDQSKLSIAELDKAFNEYFAVFPWGLLPPNPEGFDMGCGSGRWATFIAPRVGRLHCIDPSEAIKVAERTLSAFSNVSYHKASVESLSIMPASLDFGYSLGVLHHVPDTAKAIKSCSDLLKPGAPLLLYIYYAFEFRPWWFRALWRSSDFARRLIYRLPPTPKNLVTDAIALFVYWPLARFSRLMTGLGLKVHNVPLSFYRDHSFYTMRTDARDRFGTPLEQRFTKAQIERMMRDAGLIDIRFSESAPYWCAVGQKA